MQLKNASLLQTENQAVLSHQTVKDAPTAPAAVVEKAVPVESVSYTPLEAANLLAHTAHHASYHSFSYSTRSS